MLLPVVVVHLYCSIVLHCVNMQLLIYPSFVGFLGGFNVSIMKSADKNITMHFYIEHMCTFLFDC